MALQATARGNTRPVAGSGRRCGSWHEMQPSWPSLAQKQRLDCICSTCPTASNWSALALLHEEDCQEPVDRQARRYSRSSRPARVEAKRTLKMALLTDRIPQSQEPIGRIDDVQMRARSSTHRESRAFAWAMATLTTDGMAVENRHLVPVQRSGDARNRSRGRKGSRAEWGRSKLGRPVNSP